MAKNRKAAMDEIIRVMEQILPNGGNKEIMEESLGKLSDDEFEQYMRDLASGDKILPLVAPNLSENKLSVKNNLKIAKELGHNFFERLWLTEPHSDVEYLTPIPYLVVDLPLRRQAQVLDKKISVPEDSNHTDVLTGQATGPSKGASFSFVEIQTLEAQGYDSVIEELIKYRGGDEEAYRAMSKEMIDKGSVNLDSIRTDSRVKSTETLSIFLKAAHIQNNL